ncbi:hypothetical protein ANTHELSMS3_03705 [Antarctobacter heliothermus]|uniref:Uncharacterized protein n=1 Tax=Antarctobacter heliothermus TaxID=74033 RepID=A0A222E807_9RHOB|nr:hypothetical protein ANTHELSMS3_03705 [Antarctobacter heliothermus]
MNRIDGKVTLSRQDTVQKQARDHAGDCPLA